jgi:hypothetical protein
LLGPTAAELPVSIDFLGRPFSEPTLIRIAAAYERATRHRRPPPDFVGMPVAFRPGPPLPASASRPVRPVPLGVLAR